MIDLIKRTKVTVTLPIQNEDFVKTLYDNLPDTMILIHVFTTADNDPVSATFYLSEGTSEFDLGLEIGILSSIYSETQYVLDKEEEALGLTDDETKDCVNSLKEINETATGLSGVVSLEDIDNSYSNTFSVDRMNIIGQNGNDGEHYGSIFDLEDKDRSEVDYGEMDDNIGIDAQGQYYIKYDSEEEDEDYNYCDREDCDEECQDEDECDERATERYSRDTTGGVEFTLPPQEYVYDEEESINVIHSMIMKDPESFKKEDDNSPLGRLFRSFNQYYKKDADS